MRRVAHRPQVLLMVETSIIYGRRLLAGIARYLRSNAPWSVFLEQHEFGAKPPMWLKQWRGDGVISRTSERSVAALMRRRGIPMIDLNDLTRATGAPRICSDHAAIGRLAGEHLWERGFRRFAFCGFSRQLWSSLRRQGFLDFLNSHEQSADCYQTHWYGPQSLTWEKEQAALVKWLRGLSKPIGLMACNDLRGQQVMDAAHRAGFAVPEEIAVIGVDDDPLLCEFCDPPLSSVIPNPEHIGYEAAALLARLMRGEHPETMERTIEPLGVSARQSTDITAIDDPLTAAALHYIRANACRGLTIAEVLRHVPISRTSLERRFRDYFGRSPQAEIHAVQFKRASQLLAETDVKLEQIAELCGFRHASYLSYAFKRYFDETPSAYRSRMQPARNDNTKR